MKTYFYLPLDNYNQPNGNINEIKMTVKDFKEAKKNYIYIYDSYAQALQRAQN